ncbi:hypothetical protein A2U01_0081564 [Trifolium medium]|uniref:Uncharacterized protein n=1 Tax=Trifolium medium TaxID=97028 RepID=A0A392TGL9_9FABA|nr:hypothetical protein [Trifolium medium]
MMNIVAYNTTSSLALNILSSHHDSPPNASTSPHESGPISHPKAPVGKQGPYAGTSILH